jgi:hypothetical protein
MSLPDEAYWPWRELDALSAELAAELAEKVRGIMRQAGEDPDNEQLFALRCEQAAHGLGRRAAMGDRR